MNLLAILSATLLAATVHATGTSISLHFGARNEQGAHQTPTLTPTPTPSPEHKLGSAPKRDFITIFGGPTADVVSSVEAAATAHAHSQNAASDESKPCPNNPGACL